MKRLDSIRRIAKLWLKGQWQEKTITFECHELYEWSYDLLNKHEFKNGLIIANICFNSILSR